jgi:hypothetical protein
MNHYAVAQLRVSFAQDSASRVKRKAAVPNQESACEDRFDKMN